MNATFRKTFSDPRHFVALGFGSGLSPRAPGTAGSLVAALLFIPLSWAGWLVYGVIVLGVLVVGTYLSTAVARELEVKDPSVIVIDEFVGLWIACFLLPSGWYWLPVGFVLFRLFDILKPWPVSWCDRELEGGLGIMMDDVVAGLMAFAVIQAAAIGVANL